MVMRRLLPSGCDSFAELHCCGYLTRPMQLKLQLLRRTQIPAKAETDALHIAVAAVHE